MASHNANNTIAEDTGEQSKANEANTIPEPNYIPDDSEQQNEAGLFMDSSIKLDEDSTEIDDIHGFVSTTEKLLV